MEFITVEQFREQPIEVQKIFLDWWECDYGDLYYYNEDPLEYKDFEIIDNNLECDIEGDFDYFKSLGVIPIFTEGQLRKFIEDSIGRIALIELDYDTYNIILRNRGKAYITGESDLLQAYWKVACMIAKESLNG